MSTVDIGEHAFLSDCRTSALVTRAGSVDWLCLPRFDGAPVLARLLDDAAGHLSLRPTDAAATAVRRYRPKGLVLETTWTCASGELVVVDAMALGARERGHDLGRTSPGVLLRWARCTSGMVEVDVEWAPRPEFGLVHPHLHSVPLGHWKWAHRSSGALRSEGGPTVLVLSTDMHLELATDTAAGRVRLAEGEEASVAMEQADAWAEPPKPWSHADIVRRLGDTERAWVSWSDLHQRYDGPLRELVHHSGVVLQGLTYAPSGAIVAAPTTSLPEGEGSARTWDYRFTWVRDASMTMRGLWVAACPDEATRFFHFLSRAAATQLERGEHLQIMFGVGGERDLSERELPHLRGWRDSAPVRVGNGAWTQHQQDVYGALLDAAFVLREQLAPMEGPTQVFLKQAVDSAAAHWADEDQGIWEIRGPARRYLHSALMSWVALDRGIRMASMLAAEDSVPRWTSARAAIRSAILAEGWNDDANGGAGAFTQYFGGTDLDASTLLMALVGFLPGDDARLRATIDAIEAGLSDERGLICRYRGDDGLDGDEGTFLLCTFWMVEALAATGRVAEAATRLDTAAGFANDLGLLAEQVSDAGAALGNYPQAFSHLGLVLAAQAVAVARDPAITRDGSDRPDDPVDG